MDRLLLGVEAFEFLEKEGFRVLKSVLVRDEEEAALVAAMIGFPVSLKISSQLIIHKTDAGGVKIGLTDEAAVTGAFREIVDGFESNFPAARPDGVIVQKQGRGFELIVGMLTDPQFGPVIMFGIGGIFAETVGDVSFRLIPIEASDARTMMEDLRGYKALKQPRGEALDIDAIADFLVRVSDCIRRRPEIREMDLNPVFASSHGTEICDARIRVDSTASATSL